MSRTGKRGSKKTSISSDRSSNHTISGTMEEYNYDVLPIISDEKWTEIAKSAEEDKAYYKIIYEIYRKSQVEDKNEYIRSHIYPFIVMCAHIAWTKIINIYFQRCDPGEPSENYDTVWKADEEPPPLLRDSWSSHCIPVVSEQISSEDVTPTIPLYPKKGKQPQGKKENTGKGLRTGSSGFSELAADPLEQDKKIIDGKEEGAVILSASDKQKETTDNATADIKEEAVNVERHSQKYDNVNLFQGSKRDLLIDELDDSIKELLRSLFGEDEFTRIRNEKLAIPTDLLDLAIESLPKFIGDSEINDEAVQCNEWFDEEDEFGLCFAEEEDPTAITSGDAYWEYFQQPNKGAMHNKPKESQLYQKYENDPVIFDKSSNAKARVEALEHQTLLFGNSTLKRTEPKRISKKFNNV